MQLPKYMVILTSVLILLGTYCNKKPLDPVDDKPPIISNFGVNARYNSADIYWDTNECARTDVDYKGDDNPEFRLPDYEKEHSITLPGLDPDTDYRIRLKVYDKEDNEASYEGYFTTPSIPDVTAPRILDWNVDVDAPGKSATVGFSTDELARIMMKYWIGTDTLRISDDVYKDNFTYLLENLKDGATYHIKLTATDQAGNASEKNADFRIPDVTSPDIYDFNLEKVEGDEPYIKFTYKTSEPTKDEVNVTNGSKTYKLTESNADTSHSFEFLDPSDDDVSISVESCDNSGNNTTSDTCTTINAAKKYGLVITSADSYEWAKKDVAAFRDFLENWGYMVTFLDNPSKDEINSNIKEIKQKTDSNDIVVFSLCAHAGGTQGENYKIKINGEFIEPSEITNIWNNDDYRIIKFFPLTCSAKAVVDHTGMSRSISIAPCWDDELINWNFFNDPTGTGVVPFIKNNENASVRELFEYTYNRTIPINAHTFLGVKEDSPEPIGQYKASSNIDGTINGESDFLDEKAFKKSELKKN